MLIENRPSSSVISADKWGVYHPEEATTVAERKRRILTNLTFRIERGEKVLLTGPSGSGKSTFLHAVAGLDRYAGSHLREGKLKVSRERTVGLVQQDPEAALILGHVDVNVAFGPENCAVPQTQLRERVAASLGTVGLQLAAGHKTEELSGGQKQRLAIAGVVAMEPELMLLDEPTAHLDPQGVIEVRDAALRAAAKNNATLIVAEHRLTAWHGHVDRVVVLSRQGEIIADGPPGDVLNGHSEYLKKHGLWLPDYVPKVRKIVADRSLQVKSAVTLRTVGLGVSRAAGLPKSPATPWRRQRYRRRLSSIPPTVQGIDFSAGNRVPGRNIICVTGENGAGKTSFALTCANLLAAVAGEVTLQVGGTDAGLATMPPEHLPGRVGMVLQEPEHQFVASSVADEIWHGLRKASAGSGTETFTEAQGRELYGFLIRHLSLEHCQDQNPYTLSGGEKRRLALAAVLAARPRALVLDEPTAGQDNGTWRQIMGLCRGLAEAGIVLIVISHDELLRAELLRAGAAEYRFGERAGPPRHAPGGKGSDAAYYSDVEGRNNTRRDGFGRVSARRKPFLFLRSLNPLTKITMAVIFSVAAMISRDFPTASILVAVQLAVLPLSGLRLRSVLMMGWPLAAAAAVTWFSTAVMADPGGGTVISWGWYTVTEGAAAVAAAVTARMLALALAGCLMASMNGYDVGAALARWVRLPQAFVFGALAAMRLFGSLPAVWAMVAMGRRSRGVEPKLASQLVPFLVAVIRQGLRVADSMEALGMKAGNVGRPLRRTWLRPSVFSLRDAIAVVCTGMVCSGAVAFSIAAGLWQPLWR